jgi:hypothetical protein
LLHRLAPYGVVFELTPNAARTTWTESVLCRFCQDTHFPCRDGAVPNKLGSVAMDLSGNLYRTPARAAAANSSRLAPYSS